MYKPLEIDYSAINRAPTTTGSDWEKPRHVYFGPRDPATGRMKPEPKPSTTYYPRALYAKDGAGLRSVEVADEAQEQALGPEWKHSPADHGFITHPTRDQIRQMNAEEEKRGPGRPKAA